MVDGTNWGEPDRSGQARPVGPIFSEANRDGLPVADLTFDSGTLPAVRAEVRNHARRAGFSESRIDDMVLAIHELAANAVSHGAGAGRLRIWALSGALQCQVDDGDPLASGDPAGSAAARQGGEVIAMNSASRTAALSSWPAAPGHGLWVVQQVADQMQIIAGPRGTRAAVIFDLPSGPV